MSAFNAQVASAVSSATFTSRMSPKGKGTYYVAEIALPDGSKGYVNVFPATYGKKAQVAAAPVPAPVPLVAAAPVPPKTRGKGKASKVEAAPAPVAPAMDSDALVNAILAKVMAQLGAK
jgi:hypothetical protein